MKVTVLSKVTELISGTTLNEPRFALVYSIFHPDYNQNILLNMKTKSEIQVDYSFFTLKMRAWLQCSCFNYSLSIKTVYY